MRFELLTSPLYWRRKLRIVQVKVCHTPNEHRRGAHLHFRGPYGGNTTIVCDAWPVRCQTYGYLSSLRWYQINAAW